MNDDVDTQLSSDIHSVIEMAWCDKTSFDDIQAQTGFCEAEVIRIMRQTLKPKSFKVWRARVSGRCLKHKKMSFPLK